MPKRERAEERKKEIRENKLKSRRQTDKVQSSDSRTTPQVSAGAVEPAAVCDEKQELDLLY